MEENEYKKGFRFSKKDEFLSNIMLVIMIVLLLKYQIREVFA